MQIFQNKCVNVLDTLCVTLGSDYQSEELTKEDDFVGFVFFSASGLSRLYTAAIKLLNLSWSRPQRLVRPREGTWMPA